MLFIWDMVMMFAGHDFDILDITDGVRATRTTLNDTAPVLLASGPSPDLFVAVPFI